MIGVLWMNFELKKSVEDKKQVFGWANVAEDEQGNTIEDYQGDSMTSEELEKTAYNYVLKFRDTGERHNPTLRKKGKMIESIVFTKEKSDYEDGIAVYDVEFYAAEYEYEYEINASTGAVYSKNVEAHRRSGTGHLGHSGNITATGASIGEEEAKSIAVNHAGFALADVNLLKVKLDMEDGKTVYEVEFYKENKEYDYTIDASTGTILEYDID